MASSSSSSPAAAKVAARASGEVFVRADEIELESLDVAVEKQALTKALLLRKQQQVGGELRGRPMEPWEIDLAKLEISEQVKQGQFGTVFRGTYDGRDVASIHTYLSRQSRDRSMHQLRKKKTLVFRGLGLGFEGLRADA